MEITHTVSDYVTLSVNGEFSSGGGVLRATVLVSSRGQNERD